MSDIHGWLGPFEDALRKVGQAEGDRAGDAALALLGDYIHGGPDSYGVLDRIMGLQRNYGADKVIALLGNHCEMALDGSWPIGGDAGRGPADARYLRWMRGLPLLHVAGNTVFVHAGIDEEAAAAGYWELGTGKETLTGKYPAETGAIEGFGMKVVAGHVGTSEIAGDPGFHGIYHDGASHYYIDGTVGVSGVIPVLMVDTCADRYFEVCEGGVLRPILPY